KNKITKNIELIVIIDEAQNVLSMNIIKHIVTEMAKYGIRAILVTNTLPSEDIMAHTNIIIVKPHISYKLNINHSSIIINDKIYKIYKFF
ncbi:MAG: AAA family ATPase, partial [Thermoproteus sp.]